MLSTNDFAHQVWVSLEDIRERLAVLETEMRHTRCHLHRLEVNQHSHATTNAAGNPAGYPRPQEAGQIVEPVQVGRELAPVSGATFTLRLTRRAVGGGGLLGGSLAALVAAAGKALGWW